MLAIWPINGPRNWQKRRVFTSDGHNMAILSLILTNKGNKIISSRRIDWGKHISSILFRLILIFLPEKMGVATKNHPARLCFWLKAKILYCLCWDSIYEEPKKLDKEWHVKNLIFWPSIAHSYYNTVYVSRDTH